MLSELHVEHLGVIGSLDLVLGPGLIAVTGETGAGKTLIVDAIALLTGARSGGDLVRPDAAEARVDGRFVEADDEQVLSRVQPRQGRSRAYVDGRLATAAHLADLSSHRVELHGQHHHQGLLRRSVQRDALDDFAGIDTTALRAARGKLTQIDAELAALGGDQRARAREIDLLQHQIDDIERADVRDLDEEETLESEHDRLADAVELRRQGEAALEALRGEDGALDRLAAARHLVDGRRAFRLHAERLRGLAADLDDAAHALRRDVESVEEDPERLEQVMQRRQALRDLRRRYGDTLGEVLEFAEAARRRLDELAGFDERAKRLETERAEVAHDVDRLCRQIGDARRAAAPRLAAALTGHVRTLALPHATVAVTVGDAVGDPGGDAVAFWFTANPGLDPLPLARVASGGELSRIMLALRLVLGGGPATLVFDEVDAGLGGEAAAAVASALAEVARHRQVLVVTHLAQVAARAHQHLVVDKQVVDGSTVATVGVVDGEHRVSEIARMLSGQPQGRGAREHAAELLAAASAAIDTSGGQPG